MPTRTAFGIHEFFDLHRTLLDRPILLTVLQARRAAAVNLTPKRPRVFPRPAFLYIMIPATPRIGHMAGRVAQRLRMKAHQLKAHSEPKPCEENPQRHCLC